MSETKKEAKAVAAPHCQKKGCKNPPKSKRSKWCRPCYKERRKLQLKKNNVVWRDRVAKGKAGHHVVYRNKPTEWAVAHKNDAVKQAKKYEVGGEQALKVLEKYVHVKKPAKAAKKQATAQA